MEYWTGPRQDYQFPKNVTFESKMDSDLYEFAKVIIFSLLFRDGQDSKLFFNQNKTVVLNLEFTKDGKRMAVSSKDRKIRLFNVLSGKITQVIDESLEVYSTIQQV